MNDLMELSEVKWSEVMIGERKESIMWSQLIWRSKVLNKRKQQQYKQSLLLLVLHCYRCI